MLSDAIDRPEEIIRSSREQLNPHQVLSAEALSVLNERSNWKGMVRLVGHLTIMGASGYLWATNLGNWWLALPALVIYGFSFASMFAPMHEASHRTAFANNRLNDAVAWLAGLLSFYNSTFYRRYHKWHHRYTQIPGKDPELNDIKLNNWLEYWLEIIALPWWIGKVRTHLRVAFGRVENYPFLPESACGEAIRSVRWQLLTYAAVIALSIAVGHPWLVFLYWLFPLAVGQPILRFILLAEHTGCSNDNNPFTNTRTTLTLFPIEFLMWNMPFHGEHHLYPSIPFHALPAAHEQLSGHFAHIAPGYAKVNWQIVETLGQSAT
jgi:fatty acid desaturase